MFAMYVIQHTVSKEKYVGYTKDLKARLLQHNARENKSTIRNDGEWKYIYAELYRSEKDARAREMKLKQHGSAKHKLFQRISNSQL